VSLSSPGLSELKEGKLRTAEEQREAEKDNAGQ